MDNILKNKCLSILGKNFYKFINLKKKLIIFLLIRQMNTGAQIIVILIYIDVIANSRNRPKKIDITLIIF